MASPDDSVAFAAAQSQHAQEIRQRTQERRNDAHATPEEKIAAIARKVAREESEKSLSTLGIQGCTGQGRNMTVKTPPPNAGGVGASKSLPPGALLPLGIKGDVLVHDGVSWVVLHAPAADGFFVLTATVTSGVPVIAWSETTDTCPE